MATQHITSAQLEARISDAQFWLQSDAPDILMYLHSLAATHQALGPWHALELKLFGDPTVLPHQFGASLLDGIDVDLFKYAGINPSDELFSSVWANINWQNLIDRCPAAFCEEIEGQDEMPGMSDSRYLISIEDLHQFARQLREQFALIASKH